MNRSMFDAIVQAGLYRSMIGWGPEIRELRGKNPKLDRILMGNIPLYRANVQAMDRGDYMDDYQMRYGVTAKYPTVDRAKIGEDISNAGITQKAYRWAR